MSEIWYRTGGWSELIDRVEVERSTDACVFVKSAHRKAGERQAKRSEYYQYHETWAAAHAYLLDKAEKSLASALVRLQEAQGKLGNIKGIKEPAP